jgi:uncharacterized membrane protein
VSFASTQYLLYLKTYRLIPNFIPFFPLGAFNNLSFMPPDRTVFYQLCPIAILPGTIARLFAPFLSGAQFLSSKSLRVEERYAKYHPLAVL